MYMYVAARHCVCEQNWSRIWWMCEQNRSRKGSRIWQMAEHYPPGPNRESVSQNKGGSSAPSEPPLATCLCLFAVLSDSKSACTCRWQIRPGSMTKESLGRTTVQTFLHCVSICQQGQIYPDKRSPFSKLHFGRVFRFLRIWLPFSCVPV